MIDLPKYIEEYQESLKEFREDRNSKELFEKLTEKYNTCWEHWNKNYVGDHEAIISDKIQREYYHYKKEYENPNSS